MEVYGLFETQWTNAHSHRLRKAIEKDDHYQYVNVVYLARSAFHR